MNLYEFNNLDLQVGDFILIHTNSGSSWDGAYNGNFKIDTLKFLFDNHNNGSQELVCLDDLHSIIKKEDTQKRDIFEGSENE